MALKCRGPGSPLNFGLEEYEELLPMLPNLSKVWPLLLTLRISKIADLIRNLSACHDCDVNQLPRTRSLQPILKPCKADEACLKPLAPQLGIGCLHAAEVVPAVGVGVVPVSDDGCRRRWCCC